MANGYHHARATKRSTYIIATLGIFAAALFYAYLGFAGWLFAVLASNIFGCIVGHTVTPDYDINQITYTKRKLIQRNKVIGWLWFYYWYPYALLQPHRGSSHTWPYGTFIRFIITLWPLIGLLGWLVGLGEIDIILAFIILLSIFIGQSIQDFIHLIMDR